MQTRATSEKRARFVMRPCSCTFVSFFFLFLFLLLVCLFVRFPAHMPRSLHDCRFAVPSRGLLVCSPQLFASIFYFYMRTHERLQNASSITPYVSFGARCTRDSLKVVFLVLLFFNCCSATHSLPAPPMHVCLCLSVCIWWHLQATSRSTSHPHVAPERRCSGCADQLIATHLPRR